MPGGPEYVEATLAKIESISTAIGGLAGVEEGWKADVQGRLAALVELLQGMGDRFFLRTRVCLPFARKCEQAADGLEASVAEGDPSKLEAGLSLLEKAVRRPFIVDLEIALQDLHDRRGVLSPARAPKIDLAQATHAVLINKSSHRLLRWLR